MGCNGRCSGGGNKITASAPGRQIVAGPNAVVPVEYPSVDGPMEAYGGPGASDGGRRPAYGGRRRLPFSSFAPEKKCSGQECSGGPTTVTIDGNIPSYGDDTVANMDSLKLTAIELAKEEDDPYDAADDDCDDQGRWCACRGYYSAVVVGVPTFGPETWHYAGLRGSGQYVMHVKATVSVTFSGKCTL